MFMQTTVCRYQSVNTLSRAGTSSSLEVVITSSKPGGSMSHGTMLEHNPNYKILDPSCMGMGRNTVNVAVNVHGYTNVYWEWGLWSNGHHQG